VTTHQRFWGCNLDITQTTISLSTLGTVAGFFLSRWLSRRDKKETDVDAELKSIEKACIIGEMNDKALFEKVTAIEKQITLLDSKMTAAFGILTGKRTPWEGDKPKEG
jgi:hypothetical protein